MGRQEDVRYGRRRNPHEPRRRGRLRTDEPATRSSLEPLAPQGGVVDSVRRLAVPRHARSDRARLPGRGTGRVSESIYAAVGFPAQPPEDKRGAHMSRLLRAPATLYRRWRYRNYGWDRPEIGIEAMMGGAAEWNSGSELALAFLIAAGLRPDHTVLDAGCGPFRVGRLLISYLDSGGYAGFDGSQR